MRYRRAAGLLFLTMVSPKAQGQPQGVDLDTILRSFRAKNDVTVYGQSIEQAARERARGESDVLAASPSLTVEGEITPGEETSGTLMLSQELQLGVDPDRARARHSALARADLLERQIAIREEEKRIAATYLELLAEARRLDLLRPGADDLRKIASQARRAARLGTLGGLSATRAELLADEVEAARGRAEIAVLGHAQALAAATGMTAEAIAAGRPSALGLDESGGGAPAPFASPALDALGLRRQAAALERDALLGRRQLEVGIGTSRSWTGGSRTSLIAEVKVPLGAGVAARSEAAALDSVQTMLQVDEELERRRIERLQVQSEARLKSREDAVARASTRIASLESLHERTSRAFRQGQGDLAEVLEVTRDLLYARIDLSLEQSEAERARLDRYYLRYGVAP